MKTILFILLLILSSCEEEPLFCWQCDSIIYGKHIEDVVCDKSELDIIEYQNRLIDYYQGGLTSVECKRIP
jgi:hypothetical protein